MKIIIKKGVAIATHSDHQHVEGLYAGSEVIHVPDDTVVDLGEPFERAKVGLAEFLTSLRKRRDQLLMESDWTQLKDCPLTLIQATKWDAYRQLLRDFPKLILSSSQKIVWPTKPEKGQGDSIMSW